jgi:REP element-mobilizing transposase RayT
MNALPKRKAQRLKEYDYSQCGAYFVTLCTKGRREIMGHIDVGAHCVRPRATTGRPYDVHPILSDIGQIVESEIGVLSNTYDDIFVSKYVIMPNHVHMIIMINYVDTGGRPQGAPTLSRIIKQFKGAITKRIGSSIWQTSFHDHIIRDEKDYQRHWQYIDENPLRWACDEYFMPP